MVDSATAQALAGVNRRFYEGDTARSFSGTRGHAWPGFHRIVESVPPVNAQHVLDVGCGNGRLATFLARELDGRLHYHGIDASAALLADARDAARSGCAEATFTQCDLLDDAAVLPSGPFTCIAAIALLHHIPGASRRARLVRSLAARLAPGGVLVLTAWRFDRIARLQPRRTPWAAGIAALKLTLDVAALEDGDELIAWGRGSKDLRYCNLLDDTRFSQLISDSELTCVARFASDGEGGDHNEYAILRRDGELAVE